MNGINAIVIEGKVYETLTSGCCPECDFDNDGKNCRMYRDICDELNCAFRFSQTLTDKINKE